MIIISCFDDISNLNFDLNSNQFCNNIAKNGGALYLSDNGNSSNRRNMDIIFENNVFKDNYASDFGGAFYSDYSKFYMATAKNNSFINNKAGAMGGGIYFNNFIDKNLQNSIFKDNLVGYLTDDYSAKPAYVLLNTKLNSETSKVNSRDYFPLIFTLYNDFDNVVTDVNKYFNMITLRLEIKEKNSDYEEYNGNYYITGNIGTFINGKIFFYNK